MLRDLKRISLLVFIKGETVKNIVTIVRTKWARRRCILSTTVSLWGRRKVEVKSVEAGAIVMNRWTVVFAVLFAVAMAFTMLLAVQLQAKDAQIATLQQNATDQAATIQQMQTEIRGLRKLLINVEVSYYKPLLYNITDWEWHVNVTFRLVNSCPIPFTITRVQYGVVNATFQGGSLTGGPSKVGWLNATTQSGAAFPLLPFSVNMSLPEKPRVIFFHFEFFVPEIGEDWSITCPVEL